MQNTHRTTTWALATVAALMACSDLAPKPAQELGSFEILPKNALAKQGDTFEFSIKVYDKDGEEMPAPPAWAPARWFPDDPSAVFVHPDGTADLLKGGDVNILARLADLEGSVRLRINPSQVRLSAAAVYLNQVAQNRAATVPLVSGRPALLRVFATGDQKSYYSPKVRAVFYMEDEEVFRADMAAADGGYTPDDIVEEGMQLSYNTDVPARVVRPGLEVVVELDVDGVVPPKSGTQLRFPAEGRHAFDVREMPVLNQIMVPTLMASRPDDERVFDWTNGLTTEEARMKFTRQTLPIGDMNLRVREPYVFTGDITTASGYEAWLDEMSVLHVVEGRQGYYYGVAALFSGVVYGGLGWVGNPASVGSNGAYTHELGHNLNLRHAPCGGAGGPDPDYPYSNGSIGIWGWDTETEELRDPRTYRDLMGYCSQAVDWISDYHFTRSMTFRLDVEQSRLESAFCWESIRGRNPVLNEHCPSQSTLLLWGRTGPDALHLEPAFAMETRPALPTTGGLYRLAGFGDDGAPVFSFDFSPKTDEFGGSGFVFAVPYDPERDGALERVVLSGPEGAYTLGASSATPMAMVTNRETGLIRSFLRDWRGNMPAAVSGDFDVVVSEGLSWSNGR